MTYTPTTLALGQGVACVGPNGLLVGKVHEIRPAAGESFDSTHDLIVVRVGDKLIPPLPAHWFEGER